MDKETDVRVSYSVHSNPTTVFWDTQKHKDWAKKVGYKYLEFLPLRGATNDVITHPDLERAEIKTSHVMFNPYASFWKVILRSEDPLRPGEKLALYNLVFSSTNKSQRALKILNKSVVNYPFQGKPNPYGTYSEEWIQTHPAVFNDKSDSEDYLNAGKTAVWDIVHAIETEDSPWKNWRYHLDNLIKNNKLAEVHVSPGRLFHKGTAIDDMSWLKGMFGENPDYNSEMGQMIRFVKDKNPEIPFVIEVNHASLVASGVLPITSLLTPYGSLIKAHKQMIDYVNRV